MVIYTKGQKEMTAMDILDFAKRKYQLYMQDCSCGSHVGVQDKILALKAEIKELKATVPGKNDKRRTTMRRMRIRIIIIRRRMTRPATSIGSSRRLMQANPP